MNARSTTYEPGQILTLCYDVCTRADHGVTQYVTVPEPPRSRSNTTLMRYNIGGYASNAMLPRYAIAPPMLTL